MAFQANGSESPVAPVVAVFGAYERCVVGTVGRRTTGRSFQNHCRATQAEYVLFSAGKDNRWGFPREEVVARWLASGATPLNTANQGAIGFELGRDQVLSPASWTAVSRHYWHK